MVRSAIILSIKATARQTPKQVPYNHYSSSRELQCTCSQNTKRITGILFITKHVSARCILAFNLYGLLLIPLCSQLHLINYPKIPGIENSCLPLYLMVYGFVQKSSTVPRNPLFSHCFPT